jgi:hypothetical protein
MMDVLAPNRESRPGSSTLVEAVPVRHPGRWIAVTLLVVIPAMFAHMLVTNKAFQWSFMIDNMFQAPLLEGVRTTLLLPRAPATVPQARRSRTATGWRRASPWWRSWLRPATRDLTDWNSAAVDACRCANPEMSAAGMRWGRWLVVFFIVGPGQL